MTKKIIFTGGGSAGHVTPNLALIERFLEENWEIDYIGSKTGIEKELITKLGIPYHSIATGKFRRYFSWQNFIDPFKIIFGIIQAFFLCLKIKPKIIFSKGGFVSFPVVIAAKILRIPVIIHESDLTIGLANRMSFPFATKICVTFPDTIKQVKNTKKAMVTGIPIRRDFFAGDARYGREICGFVPDKKIISVFGGSLGASEINRVVRQLLPAILEEFQVVHVCGRGKVDDAHNHSEYRQFEYLHEEFPHVLAASDLVISRSGANSIYELIALRKPHILLPLTKASSRGDQILNARYGVDRGFSEMILEEQLTVSALLEKIKKLERNKEAIITAMENFETMPAVQVIYELIDDVLGSDPKGGVRP